MKNFKKFFQPKRSEAGSTGPHAHYIGAEHVRQIFERSRYATLEKYHRPLQVNNSENIEAGVTLQDCLLVAFYRHVVDIMKTTGVTDPDDLSGSDKAILVCMAVAFNASDDEYQELCQRLLPVHVEKANTFRQKWLEAHRKQPRIDEIFNDARRRAATERQQRAEAAELLHNEPACDVAYEAGRQSLIKGDLLATNGEPLYFLLPYGVQRSRSIASEFTLGKIPRHADLTETESRIVGYLHKLLANLSDLAVHMDIERG